jgi:hypothetical protein
MLLLCFCRPTAASTARRWPPLLRQPGNSWRRRQRRRAITSAKPWRSILPSEACERTKPFLARSTRAEPMRANEQSPAAAQRCIDCERTNKVRQGQELLLNRTKEWATGRRQRPRRPARLRGGRATKPDRVKSTCKKVWRDSYPTEVAIPVRASLFVPAPNLQRTPWRRAGEVIEQQEVLANEQSPDKPAEQKE